MPRKRPTLAAGAPMRLPASSARLGEGSALQRLGLAGLVIIAHVAGLGLLAQFANRPVVIPELPTISLALIQAEPVLAPVAPVAPAPAPSVPEPKVEKVESPPTTLHLPHHTSNISYQYHLYLSLTQLSCCSTRTHILVL